MYFKATVRVWRDKRDSSNRINKLDKNKVGYREFILNPERIINLLPNGDPVVIGCKFFYSDNAVGRKESLSYLEIDETVDDVQTAIDTPSSSKFYTLTVHKDNDPAKATYEMTIQADSLVYADRYNPYTGEKTWVVFMETTFRRREVLCDMSFEDMIGYTGTMTFDRTDITWDSTLVTFDQV